MSSDTPKFSHRYSVFVGSRRVGLSRPIIVTSFVKDESHFSSLFSGWWLLLTDFPDKGSSLGGIKNGESDVLGDCKFTDDFIESELVMQAEISLESKLCAQDMEICKAVYYSPSPLVFIGLQNKDEADRKLVDQIVSGSTHLAEVASQYNENANLIGLIKRGLEYRSSYVRELLHSQNSDDYIND